MPADKPEPGMAGSAPRDPDAPPAPFMILDLDSGAVEPSDAPFADLARLRRERPAGRFAVFRLVGADPDRFATLRATLAFRLANHPN